MTGREAANIDKRTRRGVLAVACLLVAMPAAHAQRVPRGRIDGVVTDSIHARPLAGALVLLARRTMDTSVSRSAATDADGRFVFDTLPPGSYVVALESAFLDSLDLASPTRTVAVGADEPTRVLLGIPSGTTLRARACPVVTLPPGTGALTGRVWDARDELPLRGVSLAVRWSETTVDPATLRAETLQQGAEVRTDSLGRFLVCGVPTDTYLDLRASLDAYRDVTLQLVVADDAGVGRQDIVLGKEPGFPPGVADADTTAALRGARTSATASLSGVVLGTATPLPRVEVKRRGGSVVVATDSLGRYILDAVPLGTPTLDLRKVGFLPRQVTVEVRPGHNTAPDVYLTPITTLDSVRVVAERTRYREFESRARPSAFGYFLRADDIARKRPLLTSDLLRQMPGFAIARTSTSDLDVEVTQPRGETSWSKPGPCLANIVIDGVPHQKINWIDPNSIGAMELYPGTSTGPVQYQSACGTILIWTKRY